MIFSDNRHPLFGIMLSRGPVVGELIAIKPIAAP
jgi:hypothetical protein